MPFIARQDLIATKRAAGRPQDLLDVALLTHPEGKPTKRRKVKVSGHVVQQFSI